MVKGYKALNENINAIFGDGMHYELRKWYEMDECQNQNEKLILKM